MNEELNKKWHKLLKILKKKGILDYEDQENLELEEYLEKKREKWWNS
jgi:hypothetical protein